MPASNLNFFFINNYYYLRIFFSFTLSEFLSINVICIKIQKERFFFWDMQEAKIVGKLTKTHCENLKKSI